MLNKGTRVALHPGKDAWMMGDRYGEIVGYGNKREYRSTFDGSMSISRPYRVKLDESGRTLRFHQSHVIEIR